VIEGGCAAYAVSADSCIDAGDVAAGIGILDGTGGTMIGAGGRTVRGISAEDAGLAVMRDGSVRVSGGKGAGGGGSGAGCARTGTESSGLVAVAVTACGIGCIARLPMPASVAVDFSSSASGINGSVNNARRGRGEGSIAVVGSSRCAARAGRTDIGSTSSAGVKPRDRLAT
jgi:hypothetical protein